MTLFALSSVRPNLDHERGVIGILRRVRRRDSLLYGLLAVAATALALSACGEADNTSGAGAGANAVIEPLPTRNPHAKAVEPVAGESAADAGLPTAEPDDQPAPRGASAQLTKSARKRGNGPTSDAAISNAEVLKGGIALPPIEAPQPVHDIIEAGNQIARTPYLWGGGHGKWLDKGYDCSGSVSYALAYAGLLGGPLDSGRLMRWGAPGPGKWVTIYTNPGHVYLIVAGVRFDTSGTRTTGSRWQSQMRPNGGFVARHPVGL
jgi:cell wall-associated NlpC family hydrolase